jgi:AGZA family xanthine/uracil permease-like MFS transporter
MVLKKLFKRSVLMEKFFKLKEHGTDVKTEIMAGVTTFLTMAYILAVNPGILSQAGMDFSKVFAATAIASAIATLVMALYANLPFALAPGMGLNAFLAYTVCLGMGKSWQFALTAVFVEGIIFLILTACNIREAIVNCIPANMKKAIGAGIGLFVAFIGMQNAGIIVKGATLVELSATWYKGTALLAMIGLIITAVLMARKVPGGMLLGIVITTIIGIPMGITKYAGGSYAPPAPYFCPFAFGEIAADPFEFIMVMFTFLFVDMFDTVGTLIGCATKTNMIQKDGSIVNCKQALFADAVGTTVGAMLGTSTVTTFVESSAGIAEGGRTGLTSLTTAILFILSLFLSPLFGSIPSAATAPALIIVGALMISPVKEIEWDDITEALPCFLTMLFMVVAYSIADGIMMGILSYVLIKLFTGRRKEINTMSWVLFALFVLKVLFKALV